MNVVPIHDRGEKRPVEVDRKIGKVDRNSVGRREGRPMVRRHRRCAFIILNNKHA